MCVHPRASVCCPLFYQCNDAQLPCVFEKIISDTIILFVPGIPGCLGSFGLKNGGGHI